MGALHRDQRRLLPQDGRLTGYLAAAVWGMAAAAAAVARAAEPFEHGWWLVAYLALVGSLSQAALVRGHGALAGDDRRLGPELALWNAGVVLVPAGVLAGVAPLVALGGVVLLVALALLAADVAPARGAWAHAYRALLVFLAGSVFVGTALGDAFPWQWG